MFLLAAHSPQEHVLDQTLVSVGGLNLTMHTMTLLLAAALLLWAMVAAARAISTGPASEGNDRYLTRGRVSQLIEIMVVFLRDQMIRPVMGQKATDRYLPYLLTVFFFVLANNLLGLIPISDGITLLNGVTGLHIPHFVGGTATGNLAVTGALAFISFLVIQAHAFKELGVKGWAHHLLGGAPWWLFPIMIPVELAGHIIKPAALAIRLFANMVAGHTLLATLAFFGYSVATAGGGFGKIFGVSLASGVFAVLISFLELFVAVLQAFIFMFLTAVFISLMSHHDDEHEEHHETADSAPHAETGAVPAHA